MLKARNSLTRMTTTRKTLLRKAVKKLSKVKKTVQTSTRVPTERTKKDTTLMTTLKKMNRKENQKNLRRKKSIRVTKEMRSKPPPITLLLTKTLVQLHMAVIEAVVANLASEVEQALPKAEEEVRVVDSKSASMMTSTFSQANALEIR